MTRLLLVLLLCAFAQADPNDMVQLKTLAHHWLESVVPTKLVFLYEGTAPFKWTYPQTDGLIFVIESQSTGVPITVTGTTYRPVGMAEFNRLSMAWREPNLPIEPNLPPEPNLAEVLASVTDPNLAEAIKRMINQ